MKKTSRLMSAYLLFAMTARGEIWAADDQLQDLSKQQNQARQAEKVKNSKPENNSKT
jgi:hypothetical protein